MGGVGALAPQWVTYGMSFLTLGIFWAGQQTQLNHMGEGTRDLTWIHLGVSVCGHPDAAFDAAAGGVHRLSRRRWASIG